VFLPLNYLLEVVRVSETPSSPLPIEEPRRYREDSSKKTIM